jgi:hypothetical protein
MEIKRATPQEMHDLACELLTDALTHLGRVDDTEDPDEVSDHISAATNEIRGMFGIFEQWLRESFSTQARGSQS